MSGSPVVTDKLLFVLTGGSVKLWTLRKSEAKVINKLT